MDKLVEEYIAKKIVTEDSLIRMRFSYEQLYAIANYEKGK